MKLDKIDWTNDLSIGNINIDNEHKELIEICNEMIDFIKLNKNQLEFDKILSKLINYTWKHFRKEETYMLALGYPKSTEHIQYHKDYNQKVATYYDELFRSNPPEPIEIVKFLKNWWTNHILHSDADFENYKKATKGTTTYSAF